jgi:excinuclease ABC subunit B
VRSVTFCDNLSELCHRITAKEHELLAAADRGDEKQTEDIRHQLDGLYRQFIYL